ncbi:MAG: hypothetical protein Q4D14_07115, partial [Bacteroidales bacterium]|nr:hypothetical protein [Bacteroidales bacterium]
PNSTTHAAFFTFTDSDYISEYDTDKYDSKNLVTSVDVMKNAGYTFSNVLYQPHYKGGRLGNANPRISQTRIMLKY